MSLQRQFKETVKAYSLLQKNDSVLVGLSGGADSVTLLYLLNSLKDELALKLHVAHLDHMLRKSSASDASFAMALAKKLKIPFTLGRVDLKAEEKKGSLEELARRARFDFLFRVAKNIKADKIALGHNLDDQSETVLMRILRGSGLYGLSGILPKRKIGTFQVIRPLIGIKRKEIEGFLAKKKIAYRIDPTNKEEIFFRNKIRRRLLPLLEKEYNNNIKEILSNMAESLSCDYDYLLEEAEKSLSGFKGGLDLKKLSRLHPSMQRLIFRLKIASLQGDTRRITYKHIKEIEDLSVNRPLNSVVNLPKGISVVKKKNRLYFLRGKFQ
ncbi:MAG TPA: tRNA lysidine(34) synthetase TilS [Candidatus Margulisiibacteriota bacterium]|nr:tRNA lysidine(34) synthetase TilS [Candidatus Margulisiibacteriota bacterium]